MHYHRGEWCCLPSHHGNHCRTRKQKSSFTHGLKNENQRCCMVICLLDEGIDTTYINKDVFEERGLAGK